MDLSPEPLDAARAVGALIAPVVACLRGDDDGVRVLLDDACEHGAVPEVVRAAPAVARVYLRLAPPPDGADRIVAQVPEAAREGLANPRSSSSGWSVFMSRPSTTRSPG